MNRALWLIAAAVAFAGCGDDTSPAAEDAVAEQVGDTPTPDEAVEPPPVGDPAAVRGTVRIFGPPGGPLPGAEVRVFEHPELKAVTNDEGKFEIAGVPAGDVTLVMLAEGYPENQLATLSLDGEDLESLDFQAVSQGIYDIFAALTGAEPDPTRCQVSTTVTRWFEASLPVVHGEPGATATISPELPAEHGPIYFNPDVLPTPGLTETSVDGGVVWTNVPPGEYVLSAKKKDVSFEEVRILCRANVLVNAGPPRGLQALNAGGDY